MPIYEYGCQSCGKIIDLMQKLNDPPPGKCDGCGAEGAMQRIISRTSFVLKGGGWYSDLYASSKKDAPAKSEPASAGTTATTAAPAAAASTPSTTSAPAASTGTSTGGSGGGSTGGGSDKK